MSGKNSDRRKTDVLSNGIDIDNGIDRVASGASGAIQPHGKRPDA